MSYLEAMAEYQEEGRYLDRDLQRLSVHFEEIVQNMLEDRNQPKERFPEWVEIVPESIFWLVKDDIYLGSIYIRHRLNWHLEKWGGHVSFLIRPSKRNQGFGKKLLQKGIPAINALGIEKALMTIAPDNTPALRIAEFCGAVLEDTTQATDKFPERRRYWLDCT